MKNSKWFKTALISTFTLALAACSSGTGVNTNNGQTNAANGGKNDAAVMAESTMKDDTTPVTIQYWHSHAEAQLDGLNKMIESFKEK